MRPLPHASAPRRSWRARVCCTALLALASGGSGVRAQDGGGGGAVEASVVRVVCATSVRALAGGGIVVGSGVVATSQRLVACAGEGGRLVVGASAGDLIPATVEWSSPARDLAILRTARPLGSPTARLAAADVPDGGEVRVIGFPGPGTVDATDRLGASMFVPTSVPGAVLGTRREGDALTHDTDAALTPGMRGAALVNACGEVAGIVGESGGAQGVRLRVLAHGPFVDALRDRRIAVSVAPTPCRPPAAGAAGDGASAPVAADDAALTSIPPWMWAVALGALLVALLPMLVRRHRVSREDESPYDTPDPTVADPVPMPVAAPPRSAAGAAAAAVASPARYHLRGLGVLTGVRTPLGERLRIGRDASRCDVVVPASAVAVSKRHAVVFQDADGLWIQDGASSNGTFVGGTRIEPNRPVRLAPGVRVHLATPDVAFVVE